MRLRRVVDGERTDDPVLFALADSQKTLQHPARAAGEAGARHGDGCARARSRKARRATDCRKLQYETFDQLYDYCYHVASVVGLICIRIFGYRDPRAEKLAEQTGVAFQLTNILRDVKEDAEMGRVYLPREDLARFGIDVARADERHRRRRRCVRCWSSKPSARASTIASADELLPLIDEDSQPALWTLVEIYRRLLERIAARNYDVFSERVRLSTAEKAGVLAQGILCGA